MKKSYKIVDLDCAHCAAKMEDAISRIPGVNHCSVSILTQKLVLDAEDARFSDILKETVKVCNKVEPDCEIIVK